MLAEGRRLVPARSGLHEHLAVVDQGPCIDATVRPSQRARRALNATVTFEVDGASTTIPVAELLAPPTEEHRRLHRLPHGAVIRHLDVPRPSGPSIYLKAMDRAAWQFALVGVAAVRGGDDVIVVASGIAATPYVLDAVSSTLAGDWSGDVIDRAAAAATEGLSPGERNGYKLPLLRGLTRRALDSLR
ncbi:MAG: hypothetical protein R2697_00975 [Ilumatobacteraceae bacterium]